MTLGPGLGADSGGGSEEFSGGSGGELPRGWGRATLGELGEWFGGGTPSKKRPEFWTDGTIPWLSPKDMGPDVLVATQDLIHESALDDSPVKLVPAGSVALVVRSGILERKVPVTYVPFEVTLNQDMKAVVPHEGINGRWLAWAIRAQEQYILENCRKRGTTVASLEVPWLMDTVILVPPFGEQCRIVAELEQQTAHVEAGEAALAEANERVSNLRSSIADAAISQHAESTWTRLQEILREPLRNGVSAKVTTDGPGVRTLTLTAVTKNDFSPQFTKVTSADPNRVKDLWLEDLDIFVQRSNSAELVGTSAIYRGERNWAIYPDLLIRVRVDQSRALPEYVALALRTNRILFYFRQNARGLSGSMPKIDQSMIENANFPLPSLPKQREAIEWVKQQEAAIDPLATSASAAQAESATLRAALLHAAFTGALVPQDPADEPASALLDRIRAARVTAKAAPRKRTPRKPRPAPPGQGELPE
ncbi:restriction endonuclease subunit S [Streptomyces canus]|uniref:restriction endonuclease subunit S n=1 Tax=Streptomyces canus TaxID=58343 RepID=UPI00224CB5BF|nr:restriction endonuclease subunit S [Streptomyces canus]MCX4859445.1 restriction endonuclease subunit S [Streptomyces canus]